VVQLQQRLADLAQERVRRRRAARRRMKTWCQLSRSMPRAVNSVRRDSHRLPAAASCAERLSTSGGPPPLVGPQSNAPAGLASACFIASISARNGGQQRRCSSTSTNSKLAGLAPRGGMLFLQRVVWVWNGSQKKDLCEITKKVQGKVFLVVQLLKAVLYEY
jgi:hypothetical protein